MSFVEAKGHPDRCKQHGLAGVLHDVPVGGDALGLLDDLGLGVRREEHNREVVPLENALGRLGSVHPTPEVDVHENE